MSYDTTEGSTRDARGKLRAIPLTTAATNRAVARIHRHHGPVPPALVHFCIGAIDETGRLCGVAACGRPANRNSDDGQTAEVLRLASDGTANVCSFLYGACARVANAMGFARIMSYTLENESGESMRGVGWTREADGIKSWWHSQPEKNAALGRSVVPREHFSVTKIRWGKRFRPTIKVDLSLATVEAVEEVRPQGGLFSLVQTASP